MQLKKKAVDNSKAAIKRFPADKAPKYEGIATLRVMAVNLWYINSRCFYVSQVYSTLNNTATTLLMPTSTSGLLKDFGL